MRVVRGVYVLGLLGFLAIFLLLLFFCGVSLGFLFGWGFSKKNSRLYKIFPNMFVVVQNQQLSLKNHGH